jgi:hypothetical protein
VNFKGDKIYLLSGSFIGGADVRKSNHRVKGKKDRVHQGINPRLRTDG